jgi:hypothetical protein
MGAATEPPASTREPTPALSMCLRLTVLTLSWTVMLGLPFIVATPGGHIAGTTLTQCNKEMKQLQQR